MPASVALNLLSFLALCAGGCRDEGLVAPRPATELPRATLLVTADSVCAVISFKILTATTMNATFPDPAACTTGLVVTRGANAKWAQNPNRRMNLYIRVKNRSAQAIQLPVRVYLPANGTTVTVPAGTPASKVLAVEPDSSEAGGGKVWFIGGTGTLAANDSTVIDTVIFNVLSPVTQARFQFVASAVSADTARPAIPTTLAFPNDSTTLVSQPGDTVTRYYRTLFAVRFDDSTSGNTVNGFFQTFGAVSVAGSQAAKEYIVRIADPGASWQAVKQALLAMHNAPGVEYAAPITYKSAIGFNSRYPTDGTGFARSDWFAANPAATWPWLAIRAPLAWGCETGLYGSAALKAAVMDWEFDTSQPDWVSLTGLHLNQPTAATATLVPPHSSTTGPVVAAHGTGVAGLMVAKGDNSGGIPGVMWDADLTLFQLHTVAPQQQPADVVSYLVDYVLPTSALSGIRLFETSADIGPTDSFTVARLRRAIRDYATAGGLIVATTGNFGGTTTIPAFLAIQTNPTGGFKAALASFFLPGDTSHVRDHILMVAGTTHGNSLWPNSTVILGATELAAPADNIVTLAPNSSFQTVSGTSVAAPFVAGAALQLWAMAPTLPADSVKAFLLLGASAPRFDPVSGVFHLPSPVTGGGGSFQLDAYGALSILSSQRPGTPICGYEVTALAGGSGTTITLEPPGRLPVTFTVAGAASPKRLSIAQGGRRIALSYDVTGGKTVKVLDQNGSVLNTVTGVERAYLEKDTADITFGDSTNPSITLTGSGRGPADANLHPLAGFAFGSPYYLAELEVSPTGDFVAYGGSGGTDPNSCGHGGLDERWQVASIHGGGVTSVWQLVCTPVAGQFGYGTGIAWNHAGNAATFTLGWVTGFASDSTLGLLRQWRSPTTVDSAAPIPNSILNRPRYAGDDGTVTLYESDAIISTCLESTRNIGISSFGSIIGNPFAVPSSYCDYPNIRTVRPNLRRRILAAGPSASDGPRLNRRGLLLLSGGLRARAN